MVDLEKQVAASVVVAVEQAGQLALSAVVRRVSELTRDNVVLNAEVRTLRERIAEMEGAGQAATRPPAAAPPAGLPARAVRLISSIWSPRQPS